MQISPANRTLFLPLSHLLLLLLIMIPNNTCIALGYYVAGGGGAGKVVNGGVCRVISVADGALSTNSLVYTNSLRFTTFSEMFER